MYKSQKQKGVLLSIVVITTLSLSGCATMNSCPGYSPAEEAANHSPKMSLSGAQNEKYKEAQDFIKTNEDFLYHDAVVEPSSFKSPYSFYLLGMEKPDDANSESPYCMDKESCSTPKFNSQNFVGSKNDDTDEILETQKDIEKNIHEKPLVLTHILNVSKNGVGGNDNSKKGCFIFNVYGHDSETSWCSNNHKISTLKSDWKREGWAGLDKLAVDIQQRAIKEKATHIILLATGWNTRQYESYLDFVVWMNNLAEDFKEKNEEFRPIFIGTSWQSEWPLWEHLPFVSELTKANDADEIGFTWENYLLNDLVKPIAKTTGAQLVVIGHSFGSRIALSAHYVRHILVRSEPVTEVPFTIIGMQAAFPIARFVTRDEEGKPFGKEHHYVEANKSDANIVITSSKDDEATGAMCIGTKYVGSDCGVTELQNNKAYEKFVSVFTTTKDGEPVGYPAIEKVSVYDASPFVNCELTGTDSGAHSDVYDAEMGRFLGQIIRGTAKP